MTAEGEKEDLRKNPKAVAKNTEYNSEYSSSKNARKYIFLFVNISEGVYKHDAVGPLKGRGPILDIVAMGGVFVLAAHSTVH